MSDTVQFDDDIQQIEVLEVDVRRLEQVDKAMRMLRTYALKQTQEVDWVIYGDKPYLPSTAAERVANSLGINWEVTKKEKTVFEDGHYMWSFEGVFSIGIGNFSRKVSIIGTASTKKPFFSKAKGKEVPLNEIDERDVQMAAFSNFIMQGVSRLLGLRSVTIEELRNAGFEVEKIERVRFKTEHVEKMKPEDEAMLAVLDRMVTIMADNDPKKKADYIREATSWTNKDGEVVPGKSSIKEITSRQLPYAYGAVRNKFVALLKKKIGETFNSKAAQNDFLKKASALEVDGNIYPGTTNWNEMTGEQILQVYDKLKAHLMEVADGAS